MGGVGGLLIGGLLALSAKMALLGVAAGPALAAALGQRAMNMYKAANNASEMLNIELELKRQIAEGMLDPREGKARLAAITNGASDTIGALMRDVETVRRLENTKRRGTRPALSNAVRPAANVPRLPNATRTAAANTPRLPNAPRAAAVGVLEIENKPSTWPALEAAGAASRRRNRRAGGSRSKKYYYKKR